MKIRDVLRTKGFDVLKVDASETVAAVIQRFATSKIRCLVVTERDALVGLVTIRDVLSYVGEHGEGALERRIGEVMTPEVMSVTPDASLDDVEALFVKERFNHLPVVEDEKLVGLVTLADVLVRHLEFVQEDATLLRDYISGVYH